MHIHMYAQNVVLLSSFLFSLNEVLPQHFTVLCIKYDNLYSDDSEG